MAGSYPQGGSGGGAGYDISASSSATSGSKQTVANEQSFEVGTLNFGNSKSNNMLLIGAVALVAVVLLMKK